jgi:sortase A
MKRFLQRAEWVCAGAGLLLLGIWAAAWLHRTSMSRASLHAFDRAEAALAAPAGGAGQQPAVPNPEQADLSLWSEKRVAAYRASLTARFDAPLAVLEIPKFRLVVPVLEGTDELTLNRGVGHIAGTARPGSPGNVGIAGHRDGFFRVLKDIAVGDRLVIRTVGATEWFQVESITVVPPEEVSVLAPTARPTITLVTCFPFYYVGSAPKRCIVRAALVEQTR